MPTKLSVAVGDEPTKMIPKENISSISKDAKVKHLLHCALDNAMSNRTGESLSDQYDKLVKLLNGLSMVDKEYDPEDSNLKFILALLGKWDVKATTIRDNHDLGEMSIDEIYGRLKTYELEMEQRSKRHGGKPKPVSLKVQEEAAVVKNKGKVHVTKNDTESSNSDNDTNYDISDSEDSDTEMMQLAALMVKSFKKMAYKNFNKGKKFTRKDRNSDRKGFKKNEGKEEKSGKVDKSKFTCFNCGEKGHFATKCKKVKNDKGQAFITNKGNWADTSDSEEETGYALMANTDNNSETAETKVPHSTFAFDTKDITELRLFLKSLHISYRDHTLENERLKSEILDVNKRNDFIKKELVQMLEVQKERDDANILGSGNWKKGLGYTEKGDETESSKPEFVKKIEKPDVTPVRFVAESTKSTKEIAKSETKTKSKSHKPKQVSIGLMTQKQLKNKPKEVIQENKAKEPRKNRNEKKNRDINTMSPKLEVKTRIVRFRPENPCFHCEFVEKADPNVSYGDGNIGKTLGYGNINLGNVIIESVALVSGLKHNVLSISQIRDRGYQFNFFQEHCEVVIKSTGKVVLKGYRHGNIYETKLSLNSNNSAISVLGRASVEDSWNWHKKLSHMNFNNINELVKKDLVKGLPKSIRSSFKSKTESSILEPYHLLPVDLFKPVNVMSIAKKRYTLVIVDEYTRYTWVYFLHSKDETSSLLVEHVKQLDKISKDAVKIIRSDNGTEFKNSKMEEFCKINGIKKEFSVPGTPQQNGVVERKNRILIEAARTMLEEAKLPTYFWAEAV
ncbi:uncharacterized protein LOC135152172 [Daucus carota subsp. sativus]|uniref:uncharacterized protein LOC135152172 n=1 Tax=Daucus carota subsp. sativus TaxID=79200 RepID=UPI0030830D6F